QKTRVAAADDLGNGGEVVAPFEGLDPEAPEIGPLRTARLPDDQRRHLVGPLDVRDVEALDAVRWLVQSQRLLEPFEDLDAVRLGSAEHRLERDAGVLRRRLQEPASRAALRDEDGDLRPFSFGQPLLAAVARRR